MSNDKPAPKFMKPGDDPELDRLLAEVRAKGSEPPPEYYYDVLGRRRRVPVVDQDAVTLVPSERIEKGAPTGPVVTETEPVRVLPRKQRLWLALGALAITGPVAALALGAFHPPKTPEGALTVMSSAAGGASAAPPVRSAAAAPPVSAVPVIDADAGAAPAVTTTPSGARPVVAPGVRPKLKDDPYDAPVPQPAKTGEPVVPQAPAVTAPPIVPPPVTATPRAPSKAPPAPSSGRILGSDEG